MKRSVIFGFALIGLAGALVQSAKAGSAVAMERLHGKLVTSYGHPEGIAKQRALETAHRLYGANVELIAATDITGYCAIAVARRGNSAVIGVALGKRSATEADGMAIDHCLKAGGTNPKIISGWRG
jgi:hypothetical protein